MQTQSPFAPPTPSSLLQMLPPPAGVAVSPNPAAFPNAFAAFASQIRTNQLQSLLQSQLAAALHHNSMPMASLQQQHQQNQQNQNQSRAGKVRAEYPIRKRVGGSTVKTAKVWRYFDELPTVEQAAECRICRKKIKATNSSTTGMIRHLRSCHGQEYQLVQEARQSSMIVKMEEKARAKLLREMNDKVTTVDVKKEPSSQQQSQQPESQKSPSASSSASDTASSASSSHFTALIAPKPIKPILIKSEVEEEPTDLSLKTPLASSMFFNMSNEFQKKVEEDHKIHMQIALMLLLDQQPAQLIDRPGFRSLFKFLLPDYQLPSSDIFQNAIVPQLLNHMKQQIAGIFQSTPHPVATQIAPQQPQQQQQQQQQQQEVMTAEDVVDEEGDEEEIEEEENVEIEDDTSSTSSSSSGDNGGVEAFLQYIGQESFSQDELLPLLSVVSNIFHYFTTRPQLQSQLSMTLPPVTNPQLIQQLQFVHHNLTAVSGYIRHTPDMHILPLSVTQETLLQKVVDHLHLQSSV